MKRRIIIVLAVLIAIAAGVYYTTTRQPSEIVITGIVTTEDVIVGPQVQGQLEYLYVKEGDHVKAGQLLGRIRQQEWEQAAEQADQQVKQAAASQENTQLNFNREDDLYKRNVESRQNWDQARTANESAVHQLAAAQAVADKAHVQLKYTEIRAPIDGIVDVRAAREGEVVNLGQPIVTLINEDDLWVRADVEETYINRILDHEKMTVRLPDGTERTGSVFYRRKDADYATQRDVSRTKRDIKTFEIRLRCDNSDRGLAVGMTAYVVLPLEKP